MTKNKAYKISLGALAAVTAVVTPIATVISCGKKEESKGPHVEYYNNAGFMVSYIQQNKNGSYLIAGREGFYIMNNGKVSSVNRFVKDDGKNMEKWGEWFHGLFPDGKGGYWAVAYLKKKDPNKQSFSEPRYDFLRHVDAQGKTKSDWKNDVKLSTDGNQVNWIWSDGDGGIIFSHQGTKTTSRVTKDGKVIQDWSPARNGSRIRNLAKADGTNFWAVYEDNKLYKIDKDGKDVKGWKPIELPHDKGTWNVKIISDKDGGVIVSSSNNTIMKFDKDGNKPKGWKDAKIKDPKEHQDNGINYMAVNKEGYIGIGKSFGVFVMFDNHGKQLDLKFTNENHNIFKGVGGEKTTAIRSVTSDGKNGFIVSGFKRGQLAHVTYNK